MIQGFGNEFINTRFTHASSPVSNTYLAKTEGHAEIRLTPLKRELQIMFAACRRHNETTTMTTRGATASGQ
jgi:hypothetical protein